MDAYVLHSMYFFQALPERPEKLQLGHGHIIVFFYFQLGEV